MTELNEYQQRANAKAVEFHALLQPIADELPDGWQLHDIKLDESGHAFRCLYIANEATGREIMARYDEYDIPGKFEFKAIAWPEYTDENGRKCTKHPGDCYQPRETAPRTKAAAGREPRAIARQIESKILPEYERLWQRCEALAAESQEYHNKTREALVALTEATGDERHSRGNRRSGFYLQGYPGSQSIEFNSIGDVGIRLPAEDMVDVIDMLYRKHTGKPRKQAQYFACPECGCTDIEMTAWVDVNSDQPNQDEPPRDDGWCPQCGDGGDGELHKCRFDMVDERKPFAKEGA